MTVPADLSKLYNVVDNDAKKKKTVYNTLVIAMLLILRYEVLIN